MQRTPDRGKYVFLFTQTRHVEDFGFTLFTNQVDHFIDGQTAYQLTVLVDHRCRDQVIALKRLRSLVGVFIRVKTHRIAGHQIRNFLVGIIYQQALDRQHALENAFVVDHK